MASDRGIFAQAKTGVQNAGGKLRDFSDLAKAGAHNTAAAWHGMGRTAAGGAFRSGVAETFGFVYGGPNNSDYRGFLGIKDHDFKGNFRKARNVRRAAMKWKASPNASFLRKQAVGMKYAMRSAPGRALKSAVGSMAGKAIFPAFTAVSMYSAYQEGGVGAALKAGATEAAVWGGLKLAGAIIGSTTTAAIGGVAALGFGYHALGTAAKSYRKGLQNLEMGAPVKDPYGTTATLRARSLQALNSSAVNGRMAMGNEALLMHDSAYSPAFGR